MFVCVCVVWLWCLRIVVRARGCQDFSCLWEAWTDVCEIQRLSTSPFLQCIEFFAFRLVLFAIFRAVFQKTERLKQGRQSLYLRSPFLAEREYEQVCDPFLPSAQFRISLKKDNFFTSTNLSIRPFQMA